MSHRLLRVVVGLLIGVVTLAGTAIDAADRPPPTPWQQDCLAPATITTQRIAGGVRVICALPSTPGPTPRPTNTPPNGAHPKGCPPETVWVSIEEWWHNSDGGDGLDAGHLHAAICWPHKATFRNRVPLTIFTTLHDSTSLLRRVYLQVHTRTADENPVIARADFRPWRSIATCRDTGGHLEQQRDGPTCTWTDTITIDVNDLESSGWKQLRLHAVVRAEDGHKGQTSSGLHFYADNGKERRDSDSLGSDPNWVEARGWWDEAGYTNARLYDPPLGPVSGRWCPRIELVRGTPWSQTIAGYRVAIDASYHERERGQTVVEGMGSFRGRPCIDTTKLRNGWHILDLRTDSTVNEALGSAQSGKLVLYFQVRN